MDRQIERYTYALQNRAHKAKWSAFTKETTKILGVQESFVRFVETHHSSHKCKRHFGDFEVFLDFNE